MFLGSDCIACSRAVLLLEETRRWRNLRVTHIPVASIAAHSPRTVRRGVTSALSEYLPCFTVRVARL